MGTAPLVQNWLSGTEPLKYKSLTLWETEDNG